MAEAPIRRGAVAFPVPPDAAAAPPPVLTLRELEPPGQLNLRGDPADPAFLRAAAGVLGCEPPVEPNTVGSAAGLDVLWLGPDEWLAVSPAGAEQRLEEALRAAFAGMHAAVTDVSGGRVAFRLSGPDARATLAKGCGLDLHPRVFGPGRCAQTVLARAGILLHQRDRAPTYDVLPRRSFGPHVWRWLVDAMAEYGGATAAAPP